MIRRDYILDQIEQFAAALAKILHLTKAGDWQGASTETAQSFQQLIGADTDLALRMSDADLMARLMQSGPTHALETRAFMLAALFKATGDVMAGQNRTDDSQECYLKGLHLLIEMGERNTTENRPDFVPTIDSFLGCLSEAALPPKTNLMLMLLYEKAGQFAKAEDALFRIADSDPAHPGLPELGNGFYDRLMNQSNESLAAGDLPRPEVEAGRIEFRAKCQKSVS